MPREGKEAGGRNAPSGLVRGRTPTPPRPSGRGPVSEAPSGRLRAMPGRRGSPLGRRARPWSRRGGAVSRRPRRARPGSRCRFHREPAPRRAPRPAPRARRGRPSRRPGRRPSRSSGDAYSSEYGERRHRACGHGVVGAGSLPGGPVLGPLARLRARCRCRRACEPLDHLGLAPRSIRSDRPGPRGSATARTRPGKPAPEPTSAIAPAPAQLRDLEPGEAVGNVGGERLSGPADGRGRVGLGGERPRRGRQCVRRPLGQVVADRESGGRFP